MTTQNLTLNVIERNDGKGFSRSLRIKKLVPAVVYGPKTKNANIALDERDVLKYFNEKYENAIFKLKTDSTEINNLEVLVKEVIKHPVSTRPIHVDFYALDLTKVVRITVKIELTGTAAGIADGGFVSKARQEVEVECFPNSIPDRLLVDVTPLKLNHSLHVSDIIFPEGVKPLVALDLTIATCAPQKTEEEKPETETSETVEPELVGKKETSDEDEKK